MHLMRLINQKMRFKKSVKTILNTTLIIMLGHKKKRTFTLPFSSRIAMFYCPVAGVGAVVVGVCVLVFAPPPWPLNMFRPPNARNNSNKTIPITSAIHPLDRRSSRWSPSFTTTVSFWFIKFPFVSYIRILR